MLSLSVIAPAYNGEGYIVPFLESVAAQTYRDFEFIIVDDSSTDRTPDLIKAYLPRLGRRAQLIRREENMGPGAATAMALSKASGDICLKMDTDIVLEPDTFAKIMESFVAGERVGLVTAPIVSMDRSNWVLRGAEVALVAVQRTYLKDAQDYEQASGMCFAFRRQIFSAKEWPFSIDADKSWLARKQGWKIVLREDITIRARFLSTLSSTFSRGRLMAKQALPAYWHHKEKLLTHWGFWIKFAPLSLTLIALFKPGWALAGLLGWLGGTQVFLARKMPDYPFADRLAAWVVTVVRWSGFNVGVLTMVVRAVVNRLKSDR